MQLKNKVAIVTGGASGIGEAVMRRFIEQGLAVAIFDMNDERGTQIATELSADRNNKVAYFNVNVTDAASAEGAVAATVEQFGDVHALVNCAGIVTPTPTIGKEGPGDLDKFSSVINVNLIGTFNVSRLVAYQMNQQHPVTDCDCRGVIVNIASIAGYEGQIGQAAYAASKAGVIGMTLTMARDLARNGIRVNSIAPGLIHTPLFDSLPEPVYESLVGQVIFPRRLGKPEEVAQLAQSILENDYMNGETVRMDGALRMQAR